MNKADLIEAIAKKADISKAAAERALEGALGAIHATLRKGGTVSLVGFGTFFVGKRAARGGRPAVDDTGAVATRRRVRTAPKRPGSSPRWRWATRTAT